MRLYAKFCVTPLMVCLQIFGECRVLSSVVLIKVGGSSITQKAVKETLNVEALNWFVRTISQLEGLSFVLVHGAGSFGHHMAKEHGLRGQTEPPKIMVDSDIETKRERMRGLSRTRLSVQKLNQAIVSAFLEQGQAAVGISPCFGVPGVQAHGGGETAKTLLRETVKLSVDAGLIPILHGDACLYGKDGAGILSGDTVTEILGRASWVSHVVFLTDVDGVFTADPNKAVNAVLLRDLTVDTVSAKITSTEALNASGSSHDHDVTGGLQVRLRTFGALLLLVFRFRSNLPYHCFLGRQSLHPQHP